MTREERAITNLKQMCSDGRYLGSGSYVPLEVLEDFNLAIKALEQESRKDEVILTKEEYGELVSNEFDNGYAKGYREALEQEPILDKIRAEILELDNKVCQQFLIEDVDKEVHHTYRECIGIIDKYKAESEVDNGNDD